MKRVLVLSDVHGNLAALEEILGWGEAEGTDEIWNLGDTLGIGSEGIACFDLLKEKAQFSLLGNHDYCAANPREAYRLNSTAPSMQAELARIFAANRDDIISSLREAPLGMQMKLGSERLLACHATPISLWEFLQGPAQISLAFNHYRKFRFILCGHTHVPYLGTIAEDGKITGTQARKVLNPGVAFDTTTRYVLNPGAVGGLGKGRAAGILTLDKEENPLRFDWRLPTK
jgi:predicted phosphodiesterase